MLLYQVPKCTLVRVEGIEEPVLFHHIDGAYSVCTVAGKSGTLHLGASTKVDIIGFDNNENRNINTD